MDTSREDIVTLSSSEILYRSTHWALIPGGHLGIFGVGMCRAGLQIGKPANSRRDDRKCVCCSQARLLEKGVKLSFVLIAIIRYFKLSSKQIISILRRFLSSSSHLIVKFDFIPPWKSEDFLRVTDPTCSDMLSRCYKAFYVSLIL